MANTVKQRLQELKHQFSKSEKLFNELAKYRSSAVSRSSATSFEPEPLDEILSVNDADLVKGRALNSILLENGTKTPASTRSATDMRFSTPLVADPMQDEGGGFVGVSEIALDDAGHPITNGASAVEIDNIELRSKLQQLRSENELFLQQRQTLIVRYEKLRAELHKAKNTVKYLEEELVRHASLADNLAEFRIKIEDLETEKATTEDSLRSLRTERDAFAEQVAALQRQLKSLTEDLSGAHLQLRDELTYRKEADLQREEAREIADEAHSSLSQFQRRMQLRVQELETTEEQLMEKLSKLRDENEGLRLKLEERAADVHRSQSQVSKLTALEADYERVKSKFEGVSQEFTKFRALYANLEEENEHMRKQVETERTARRALEEEVLRQQKRLEQVRAEHDTALEKLQDAAKRVSQLESVQAVQQRAALSSSYSAGSSPDRDFGPTSSSAARSRTALTFTGVTQTELAGGHIDGLRQELADVRQQLDTVLARNRELERTLRTLETTHIEVSSKTSTLQSQMETLRGENESLQLRLDLKDRQNISAEVDLKQANLRCGTLQTDLEKLQSELQRATDELRMKERAAELATERERNLISQNRRAEMDAQQSDAKVLDMCGELDQIRTEWTRSQQSHVQQTSALRHQLTSLQASYEARNKEALAMEGAIAELGTKLKASQQSAEEMRSLVARAESELERMRSQLKRFAEELDAANALHARAVDEFQQSLRESREATQSWEARASQARLALTDTQRIVSGLEGERASAIARAVEYEKTLGVLDQEVTERRQQVETVSDELAATREQSEFNAHECTALRTALDEAQRECRQTAEERLALRRRAESLELELQAATEKLRRLEPECSRLAASEREAATALQTLQRRLAEGQEAQRRSAEERKSLELEFQSLLLKCQALEKTREDMQKQHHSLVEIRERTEMDLKRYELDLRRERESNENLRARLAQMEEAANCTRADATELHRALHARNDQLLAMENQLRERSSAYEAKVGQVSILEQQLEVLANELRKVTAEKNMETDKLYAELKQRERKVNELSDALAERSSRLETAQESTDEAKRAVKAVVGELEACQQEASECRASLAERESTVREVRADCERLIASLKTVRDTLHTRDIELARLQKAFALLETERDQLLEGLDESALVLKKREKEMARALEAQFASHIADQQAALYQKAQGQLQHMHSERNTWENLLESERTKHAEEYSKILTAKTSGEAEYERKLTVMNQENSRLREELSSTKERARRVAELEELIDRQKIVLANAEESLLLKDSKITRLEAKLKSSQRRSGADADSSPRDKHTRSSSSQAQAAVSSPSAFPAPTTTSVAAVYSCRSSATRSIPSRAPTASIIDSALDTARTEASMRTIELPPDGVVPLSRPALDISALLSSAGTARALREAPDALRGLEQLAMGRPLDFEALVAAASRSADVVDDAGRSRLSSAAAAARVPTPLARPGILKPPSQRATPEIERYKFAPAAAAAAQTNVPVSLLQAEVGESPPRADDRLPYISQSRLRHRLTKEGDELVRHDEVPSRPPAPLPPPVFEEHQSRQHTSQRVVETTSAASRPPAVVLSSPSKAAHGGQSESFGGESAHNLSFPNEFVLIKGRASDLSSSEQLSRDQSEDERDPLTAGAGRSRSAAAPRLASAVAAAPVSRESSEPRPGSAAARRGRAPAAPVAAGALLGGDSDSNLAVSDRIQSFISSLREHSASREALIKKEYNTRMQDMEYSFGSKDKLTPVLPANGNQVLRASASAAFSQAAVPPFAMPPAAAFSTRAPPPMSGASVPGARPLKEPTNLPPPPPSYSMTRTQIASVAATNQPPPELSSAARDVLRLVSGTDSRDEPDRAVRLSLPVPRSVSADATATRVTLTSSSGATGTRFSAIMSPSVFVPRQHVSEPASAADGGAGSCSGSAEPTPRTVIEMPLGASGRPTWQQPSAARRTNALGSVGSASTVSAASTLNRLPGAGAAGTAATGTRKISADDSILPHSLLEAAQQCVRLQQTLEELRSSGSLVSLDSADNQ